MSSSNLIAYLHILPLKYFPITAQKMGGISSAAGWRNTFIVPHFMNSYIFLLVLIYLIMSYILLFFLTKYSRIVILTWQKAVHLDEQNDRNVKINYTLEDFKKWNTN